MIFCYQNDSSCKSRPSRMLHYCSSPIEFVQGNSLRMEVVHMEDVDTVPSEEQCLTFLQQRATSAGCLPAEKMPDGNNKKSHSDRVGTYVVSDHKHSTRCRLCKEVHPLYVCEKFKRKLAHDKSTTKL